MNKHNARLMPETTSPGEPHEKKKLTSAVDLRRVPCTITFRDRMGHKASTYRVYVVAAASRWIQRAEGVLRPDMVSPSAYTRPLQLSERATSIVFPRVISAAAFARRIFFDQSWGHRGRIKRLDGAHVLWWICQGPECRLVSIDVRDEPRS